MLKKIITAFLLTIIVLAFPVRLLDVSPDLKAILKIVKGVLFITLVFILMQREKMLSRPLVLKEISLNIYIRLLPVITLISAYVIYFLYANIATYQGSTNFLVMTLMGTFVAASAEEVIFRGYILNLLKKNGYSFIKSLLLSSIFFSLVHIVNVFRYEDVWPLFNQLVFAFALGILFGSVYALTQNLLLVCIFHFLINIPSAIETLSESTAVDLALLQQATLFDNLLSSLFFIILTLPVLMLASYYIKLVNKNSEKQIQESQLSVVD